MIHDALLDLRFSGTIEFVATASEAIRRLKSRAYRLLVLDFQFTGNDRKALRLVLEASGTVPVVAFTGFEDAKLADFALKLGVKKVVDKPVAFSLMREAVKRILEATQP